MKQTNETPLKITSLLVGICIAVFICFVMSSCGSNSGKRSSLEAKGWTFQAYSGNLSDTLYMHYEKPDSLLMLTVVKQPSQNKLIVKTLTIAK